MTGRYVPPHLRNQGGSIGNSPGHDHGEQTLSSGSYTIEDINTHYGTDGTQNTLNHSANDTTAISHILIFRYAHPEWPPKVYCKTNIDLLEPYLTSTTATTDDSGHNDAKDEVQKKSSIPVFVEVKRGTFDFFGYHVISSVEVFEPRSEGLIALMESKFNRGKKATERRAEKWKESLGMRWAVVTLERDKIRTGEGCGVVKAPQKSVTELLKEMRLQDKDRKENQELNAQTSTELI